MAEPTSIAKEINKKKAWQVLFNHVHSTAVFTYRLKDLGKAVDFNAKSSEKSAEL